MADRNAAKILCEAATEDGSRLSVSQPDAEHVSMLFLVDGQLSVARLTSQQAVALATAILFENPTALSAVAERLGDEAAADLAARFLAPAAERALARAAEGGRVH